LTLWRQVVDRRQPASLPLKPKSSNHAAGIETDRSGYVEIFQNIEAPIAALVLRDIRRWLTKPLCDKGLRQTGGFALFFEQPAQLSVTLAVDGLGQVGSRKVWASL